MQATGSPAAGLGAALLVAAAAAALVHRLVSQATHGRAALSEALRALAAGGRFAPLRPRELGDAAEEAELLNTIGATLVATAARVAELTRRVHGLLEDLGSTVTGLERSNENQVATVEETASLQIHINSSIRQINAEVENLAQSNEGAASSIIEMRSSVEQVAVASASLQGTVESSTSSIHQMDEAIRRVARSCDTVQEVAEETAASTSEMDRTIQEVGEHTRGASELTEQVSASAEMGSEAVGATIEGIEEIRKLTGDAKTAIEGLAVRIREIGSIAGVIGGISDETNLLSLNAAIIAAQAGEHGKAFAVVADQVKTLAQRTTQSTKEIDRLLQTVQQESDMAVRAMDAGASAVEEGVGRSRHAGEALERIRSSARDASGRVAEIARAAEEQGRNSRHVAQAAQRTSEHVQQIASAMTEQAAASQQLLSNAKTSVEMCRQVTNATEEQRSTGRYITSSIESITEMIGSIQQNTQSHERASSKLGEAFNTLLDNANQSGARLPELMRALSELCTQADELAEQVARYSGDAQ